jgi:hypothetical protein
MRCDICGTDLSTNDYRRIVVSLAESNAYPEQWQTIADICIGCWLGAPKPQDAARNNRYIIHREPLAPGAETPSP